MGNIFSDYTKCYQLSKTLRFSLIPQGKTLENIEKNGIITEDNERAEKYKKVKPVLDKYHRDFIENAMSDFKDDWTQLYKLLAENQKLRRSGAAAEEASEGEKKTTPLETEQEKMRKSISKYLTKHPDYKNLDPKAIIEKAVKNQDLPEDITQEDIENLKCFNKFSTYFSGYKENRENIYGEEKSVSVSYRTVNDNFTKFAANCRLFDTLFEEDVDRYENELKPLLRGYSLREIFSPEFYNNILNQKGIDFFNSILGGITENETVKIKGLNELCNLDFQQRGERKIKFIPLFGQILGGGERLSFIPVQFESDAQLIESVNDYGEYLQNQIEDNAQGFIDFIKAGNFDFENIFIDKKQISFFSQIIFDNEWSKLGYSLKENGTKEKSVYTLAEVLKVCEDKNPIEAFCKVLGENLCELSRLKGEAEQSFSENHIVSYDPLKAYLDKVQECEKLLKIFAAGEDAEGDGEFYSLFDAVYTPFRENISLYNRVRNYATRKLQETVKVSLKFGYGNFLGGWVDSKTDKSDNGTQYGGYLFRKRRNDGSYDYFLGISRATKILRPVLGGNFSEYERLYYYQLKSQSVFGSLYAGKQPYSADKEEIIEIIKLVAEEKELDIFEKIDFDDEKLTPAKLISIIKNNDLEKVFLSDSRFAKKNQEIIINIKNSLRKVADKIPQINLVNQSEFEFCSDMIDVVDELSNIKSKPFVKVSDDEMKEVLNREINPLYLFKISNKDLNHSAGYSKNGKKNLHTLYFEELMKESDTFDLGSGMVFFRPKAIENPFMHRAGEYVVNRHGKDGNVLSEKIHKELVEYYNDKISFLSKEAEFEKENAIVHKTSNDIIKDRRYSENKFLFHLSIFINPALPKKTKNFNASVLEKIADNEDVNIIGIDRGERNLIYVSCINQRGEILEQRSFNVVGSTDYHKKLDELEKQRDAARKNWKSIDRIKDMKEGYLSGVIHEITEMMLRYNAIIVMEDLNFGFKRGRFHIEKQVYQKFEKMLIEKLNYLADKSKDPYAEGGVCCGYQLADKFESFQRLGKQSGFIFYVPAANTSKIDPKTGFVNLFTSEQLRYSSVEKTKAFFKAFESISYNSEKKYFSFTFRYSDFNLKRTDSTDRWTVCTYGERLYHTEKNGYHSIEKINVTEKMYNLLKENGIDPESGELIEKITSVNTKEFFSTLIWLFKVVLQLRYESPEEDFILSPVECGDSFFDSRTAADNEPSDGDANGAYHIALQGLRLISQRIEFKGNKVLIKKDEAGKQLYNWLRFAQEKPYLN